LSTTYRSVALEARPEAAGTVVIHCSDPRYQPHFQDFLRNGLGVPNYALIAVPGGAQFLTLVDYLPKFSWVGWRWVKFVVDLTKPRRIILIGHEDCRWYLDFRFGQDPARLREKIEDDMRRARSTIRERFGSAAAVELYWARLEDSCAAFDPIS
jgi:hypothetical protein